ncbi:MAG: sugar phosphate isomerase/epimerase family protein [Candidatus Nanopelagicales bacterium]
MASPELSVQLYTLRATLESDLEGTLDRLAGLGLRNVEGFNFVGRGPELRAAFDARGMRAASGHAHFLSDVLHLGEVVIEVPEFEQVLDDAEALGMTYLIEPMVTPDRWTTPDDVARTAERLNAAAERAAERGIRVGYHNHTHEFHHSFDGVTAYEAFVGQLRDDVVIELDAFWAQTGGQDVPALITRLGDRVKAMHVKDGIIKEDPFRAGRFFNADLDQRPAGEGEIQIDAALAAATALELAVIEFDRYDGDVFEGVEGTVRFLAERGIR